MTEISNAANHLSVRIKNRISRPILLAPLITFRIFFGLLMFFSTIRFWWRGWVATNYVDPSFHFTYLGFEWVKPMSYTGMHVLFLLMAFSAIGIAVGWFYRISAVLFFLLFTYVELLDVTTYLNHYYFVSLVSFLMIWMPAHRDYSVDTLLHPEKKIRYVPIWIIGILRFQIAIVYIFAGLAKLDPDWMLLAQPMRIWLPSKSHLPFIGQYLYETWMAYLFSWFGAVYDLFIIFFLLNRRTRAVAYVVVVIFHVATAIFFPVIGMFPYIMMLSSLIFFSGAFHEKLLSVIPGFHKKEGDSWLAVKRHSLFFTAAFIYLFFQLAIPLRFLLYPDRLFWNEEGYRFSWRVMLMEKSGTAFFTVKDKGSNASVEINNAAFLTPLQEKMMSTQPDLILKYAHHLADIFKKRGMEDPAVFAEVYVTLNGRRSTLFIDSTVNLAKESVGWKHYKWVIPFKQ